MADEDRQSDKMALTALLVVLLVRKIRRMRSRRRKTWDRMDFEKSATRSIPKIFYVN